MVASIDVQNTRYVQYRTFDHVENGCCRISTRIEVEIAKELLTRSFAQQFATNIKPLAAAIIVIKPFMYKCRASGLFDCIHMYFYV